MRVLELGAPLLPDGQRSGGFGGKKKKIFSMLYCRLGLFRLYKNAAVVTNLLFGIFSANTTLDARSFYQDLAAQSCKVRRGLNQST